MEKEFAGGVLFDKRKTPFEEEGIYGIPGTKNPNDILSFLDQNPFLQGHPYFEELLEKERLFRGFPRDPEPEAEKEEENTTTAPLQPENNQPENNQEEQDIKGNDPEQLQENKPQAKEVEVVKEDKAEKEVDATQTKEEVEEAAPEKVEQPQSKDKEADQPESPGNKDKTNQPKVDAPESEQPANIENNEAGAGGEKAAEKKTFKAETTGEFMNELASSSPSDFIQGMQQAPQLVPGIEGKEKETLKESLPEIDKPTGLPAKDEAGKKKEKEKADAKEGKKPELKTKGEAKSVDVNTQHEVPKNAVISEANKANLKGKEGKADPEEAKAEIRKLPGNDKGVNTNPGKAPKVKLTEEANPVQNTENKDKADESVKTELAANQKQTQNDFGEHDIFPEIAPEKLSPNVELQDVPALENQGLEAMPEMDAETLAAFNAQAKQQMDEKLGAEKQKQEEAYSKMEVDSDKARKDNEKRIEEETASVKARQEGEQQKAQAEVGKQRTAWQAENEKITADYTKDAAAEKASVEEKIDSEVSGANEKVEQEFKTAQAKADAKQAEAERDAKSEKDAAENKDKSFWDRAVDAVSSFIDKVKKAINKIFDALRAFVKQVIEAAKKLAKSIIELARKAVVGLIKLYAEVLKKLVSIVLFAFPKLAAKFNALIDKAVDLAVKAVNKLADLLKKTVCMLLDALGVVLDTYLAAYQKAFNLIMSAIEFIAVGLLKALQMLGYIVEATKLAFTSYFVGSMSEAFLGADVSAPLKGIERTTEEEKTFKGEEVAQSSVDEKMKTEEGRKEQEIAEADKLDESQVAMQDGPVPFNPQLLQSLLPMKPGKAIELGGSSDPITREEIQAALFNDKVEGVAGKIYKGSAEEQQDLEQPVKDNEKSNPDWWAMSDAQKLDHYINIMGQDAPAPEPGEAQQKPEQVQGVPLVAKTAPLSVGQRLAFTGRQMMKGMSVFWQKNKGTIMLGILGGILALGVAAILTGPAGVIALIQIAMQALTVLFAYQAVKAIAGHLKAYLQNSIKGQVEAGGKSLAMALAVLIAEFLFEYIMRGVGKALKRVKNTIKANRKLMKTNKAVRAARKVSVAVRKTKKQITGWVKRKGKIVLNAGAKQLSKVKSLNQLKKKLDDFRLKRIWVKKTPKFIELWGEFNPEFVIMRSDGKEERIDADNRFKDTKAHQWRQKADGQYQVKKQRTDEWVDAKKLSGNDAIDIPAKYKRDANGNIIKDVHKRADDADGFKDDLAQKGKERVEHKENATKYAEDNKVDELLEKRKTKDLTKSEKDKVSEYHKKKNQVTIVSRDIGEVGAESAMKKKYPGYDLEYGGVHADNVSGTFDQLYVKKGPPKEFILVEAKGGSADVGSAKVNTSEGMKRAEQGTKEYKDHIIKKMLISNDKEIRKLGRELNDALEFGDDVEYIKAHTPIDKQGNILDTILTEFDLTS